MENGERSGDGEVGVDGGRKEIFQPSFAFSGRRRQSPRPASGTCIMLSHRPNLPEAVPFLIILDSLRLSFA